MPTYEYACKQCGDRLEAVQKFTDDALTTCPACQGALRKVFGAVGIAFKGSGFYKTDSRSGAKKSATASVPAGDASSSSDTKSSDVKSTDSKSSDSKSSDSKSSGSKSSGSKSSEKASSGASSSGSSTPSSGSAAAS